MSQTACHYARFDQRVLAWLLDIFLLFALLSPFLYLLNTALLPLFDSLVGLILYRLVRLVIVLTGILYGFAWCLHRYGATPGKLLIGIKVIDQKTHHTLSRKQAAIRLLLSVLSTFSGLGVLLILFNRQRQAIHDKMLHTLVIQAEDDYAHEHIPADRELYT